MFPNEIVNPEMQRNRVLYVNGTPNEVKVPKAIAEWWPLALLIGLFNVDRLV